MKAGQVIEMSPKEKISCIRSGADGGPFVFDMELGPRGSGPPKHTHDEGDETIEVLSGEIVFVVGRTKHLLSAGEQLTLTPADAHTFYNPSRTESVVCRVTHGSRFERALEMTRFPDMAHYITVVDPGASRMASPFVRATLRIAALFRSRGAATA